ncbi:carboxypeptidase regulatory-like domain-containing protein [Pontibacter sp. FD36]|uniref:carboxypeptidase regulatory-like domain-containing protein n=1 Tax=Pontibacter sp. FD36 TaxID=2789860 RepID=UPI0018A8FF5E|nr:carboxypeptidase regulatory-like domain-containing protein [Pontibacter sp. FD36]MBF8962711.1 carboxypeptidase regulatory-like domain-containing protein [Pontibacter sp. FD36]
MKTKIYPYALLLALVCLLSSCTKEEDDYISKYCPGSCTEVSGQVLRGSGQPIKNMQLLVTWQNLRPFKGGGGGIIRKKAVAYTDDSGNYTLRFLLRDDEMEEGHIEVAPQGRGCSQVNCQSYTLYWDELKRDTTFTHNFLID